jgi:hypothetical protein
VQDDALFEKRWQDVGANLRAGLARIVIAMDDARPRLERIVRFLAENSQLNVQLVTIERYPHEGVGDILVPRVLVGTSADNRKQVPPTLREPRQELMQVVAAYNRIAKEDMQAVGVAANYRQVRPPDWPTGMRTHYEFMQTSANLSAELHIESDRAKPLAAAISVLAGTKVLGGKAELIWDPSWNAGRGRLLCRLPLAADPDEVAAAMRELIATTRNVVREKLSVLATESAK